MMKLSNRETEILMLVGQGYADKEIACKLKISSRTVQTHMNRIILKLQARNRASAINNYFTVYRLNYT